MLTRLTLARLLLVAGFLTGLASLGATFGHIGDPSYLVSAEFDGGRAHSWYHALREVFADVSTIAVLLLVFFGAPRWRKPETWWLCLILLLGYYLPFWAGMPFLPELRAPSWSAELNHIAQAVLALAGLFLGRPAFHALRPITNKSAFEQEEESPARPASSPCLLDDDDPQIDPDYLGRR